MAASAPMIQYRQQLIDDFAYRTSKFRAATTKELVIRGSQAVFAVAGAGTAKAVTRGRNGLIPASTPDFTQNTVTLEEIHHLNQMTDFSVFESQGDTRRIMQKTAVEVLNREIDDRIITVLSAATQDTGTAAQANLALFARAKAILGNADVNVDDENNLFCALTPAAEAYLLSVKEFTSADFVEVKPLGSGAGVPMRRWMGINFFVSSRLSGNGTSAEKVLMWHRNAVGLAANTDSMDVDGDKHREQNYYWDRASLYVGAKLLQNSGVVVINHNGAGIAAE